MSDLHGRKCPHGRGLSESQIPAGGWSGGVGYCRCCFATFGYIDRGDWSVAVQETVTNDQHLCRACGGKTIRRRTENGVTTELVDEAA